MADAPTAVTVQVWKRLGVWVGAALPGAVKRVWEPQSGASSLNWKVRTCGACVSMLDATERKCGSQSDRGLRVGFKV